jgi:hypothetical protein
MAISKAMSLAVQSATGMRSCDLARANRYSDQEATTLGDLVVKVVNDAKGICSRELLTLRYIKGQRCVSAFDQMNKYACRSSIERVLDYVETDYIVPLFDNDYHPLSLITTRVCIDILSKCKVILYIQV